MKILLSAFVLLAAAAAGRGQTSATPVRCDSSSLTYQIVHPLHEVDATSTAVQFRVGVDTLAKTVTSVAANVDVMTFDSGNSNRDSHAMEVVDALTFPEASFRSTSVTQRHDSLSIAGTLLFHGVTKPVRMDALSRWGPSGLRVDGGFNISLTEFQIERPSMMMMPVNDTLRFVFHSAFHWK
jgi:polyisoprenoid-binding protein YceI